MVEASGSCALKVAELRIKRGEDPNERREAAAAPADASGWTVREMFDHYAEDMRQRECRDRSIADMLYRRDRYLSDWLARPITGIRKNEARTEHKRLSTDHGKRTANQVMKDFRWAYNLALKIVEDADALGDNPTNAITWNKERASDRYLADDELPEWWAKVDALNNPIRRTMHQFGLLSGLRPGTLMSLRRDWVRHDARCVSIPRMKSDRAFDLPLSPPMIAILREALAAGDTLFGKSEWLFPTRARTQQMKVIATNVVKEKTLPSQTGHILRHTYRTKAKAIGVDDIDARLLLDHTVPGIDGVYLHARGLFERLLSQQERMSEALLALRSTPLLSE
jgi:integrase